MNILFDLSHPAHYHLFKNLIIDLKQKGHHVWVTAKSKDVLLDLLNASQFDYILLKKSNSRILNHINGVLQIRSLIKQYFIDFVIGVTALGSQACIGTKAKSIVFDDDDISATPIFAAASHSFANHVISPDVLKSQRSLKKYFYHHSLHELAYLHPNRFNKDIHLISKLRINIDQKIFILRFSSMNAHHDVGERGINTKQTEELVQILEQKGRVLITSEKVLPTHLQKYYLHIAPKEFHHVLACADMLVCDSQTVASEAAVLGVPSVRINTFVGRISYLEELEHKYQLTFGFKPWQFIDAIEKIKELLSLDNSKYIFEQRRQKMLKDKIDLTAFMIWFINLYPKSVDILKQNPDYQLKFK